MAELLEYVATDEISVSEFVPYIGYVVAYTDPDESHCGILTHVEKFPKGSRNMAQTLGRRYWDYSTHYLHFQGRDEPVAVIEGKRFSLEVFR